MTGEGTFGELVAAVTDAVLHQIVGEGAWAVEDVGWLETAPPPPSSLTDMAFPAASLYESTPALLALRQGDAVLRVAVRAREGRFEVHVPASAEPGLLLVTLAEQLQDHALESAQFWGQPLPRCPVHQAHPAAPREVAGLAVWACPRDGAVAEIPGAPAP